MIYGVITNSSPFNQKKKKKKKTNSSTKLREPYPLGRIPLLIPYLLDKGREPHWVE